MKDKITQARLNALPKTAIVIQRKRFRLTVYHRMGREYARLFRVPVSIGRLGFETPAGQFLVLDKEAPPTYTAPNSDWALEAGYEPGQTIPADDPANPLRGAWLRISDTGIGLHGTSTFPLGQKASHGCVRLMPKDALAVCEAVELGSPVTIL